MGRHAQRCVIPPALTSIWSLRPHDHNAIRVRNNQRRHRDRARARARALENQQTAAGGKTDSTDKFAEKMTARREADGASDEQRSPRGLPRESPLEQPACTSMRDLLLEEKPARSLGQQGTTTLCDKNGDCQCPPLCCNFDDGNWHVVEFQHSSESCSRPLRAASPGESTTTCKRASQIIAQQNFLGLDAAAVRSWLRPGYRRGHAMAVDGQHDTEGCRVDSRLLYRLMDYMTT